MIFLPQTSLLHKGPIYLPRSNFRFRTSFSTKTLFATRQQDPLNKLMKLMKIQKCGRLESVPRSFLFWNWTTTESAVFIFTPNAIRDAIHVWKQLKSSLEYRNMPFHVLFTHTPSFQSLYIKWSFTLEELGNSFSGWSACCVLFVLFQEIWEKYNLDYSYYSYTFFLGKRLCNN